MSAFTPGPWAVEHLEGKSLVRANTILAFVYSTAFRDFEQQMANGRLIAEAPELFIFTDKTEDMLRGVAVLLRHHGHAGIASRCERLADSGKVAVDRVTGALP